MDMKVLLFLALGSFTVPVWRQNMDLDSKGSKHPGTFQTRPFRSAGPFGRESCHYHGYLHQLNQCFDRYLGCGL
jgi:hypothetical protein